METRPQSMSMSEILATARDADIRFRLLGFFPLIFFLGQMVHYLRINQPGHLLWMCNIGNLIMAIGLFINRPVLIRVAVLWMVPGLFIWWLYVVSAWGVFLTSTLAHVGGLIVGMFVLRRTRMDRTAWLYALLWFFALQFISRLITPAELNVNVSHRIYGEWRQTFASYWTFWLVLSLGTALLLWILGLFFHRFWPSSPEGTHL